jgi:hypothetical protein
MAIDIITKAYYKKGNNNGGQEDLSPKETLLFDITTQGWQKFMEEHKALFTKMYDMRINKGLSFVTLLLALIGSKLVLWYRMKYDAI